LVGASVVFGVGHGPVDAVVVSVCGVPGEGFAAVVSAAERIQISAGGFAVRCWLVVVQVAPVGGHGAGGESAAAGPDFDGCGEPG
jgi:hypothetical protein